VQTYTVLSTLEMFKVPCSEPHRILTYIIQSFRLWSMTDVHRTFGSCFYWVLLWNCPSACYV